jgi:hypothetical protein
MNNPKARAVAEYLAHKVYVKIFGTIQPDIHGNYRVEVDGKMYRIHPQVRIVKLQERLTHAGICGMEPTHSWFTLKDIDVRKTYKKMEATK